MTPAWVIVTAEFNVLGGQDKANWALARHLAERGGARVHLVAHRVDEPLASHPAVEVHRVRRPLGWRFIGDSFLGAAGRRVARRVLAECPGARVVVNGGNCCFPDVNWVHMVHHACPRFEGAAPLAFRLKERAARWRSRRAERRALAASRLVIANSERTRRDVVELLGVAPERIRLVHLGCDAGTLPPGSDGARATARKWLGVQDGRLLAVFVGALGHSRLKGFDTLLAAWRLLVDEGEWPVDLVAAGGGALESWRRNVDALRLSDRVRLLGFTERIPELLTAADVLVSPTRYDAYGLNVHEALCRGVPAIVSARAGIAERYPPELADAVLADPEDPRLLADRLRTWFRERDRFRAAAECFGATLRAHTWDDMAAEMVALIEAGA